MSHGLLLLLTSVLLSQTVPDHESNPIYQDLIRSGLTVGDQTVRLPEPTLIDGQDAQVSELALRKIAGDDRAVRDLTRDSVTAPFVLKSRDLPANNAIIRSADLWFVVHARLEDVDPEKSLRQSDHKEVEAGNMRFESTLLPPAELEPRKVTLLPPLPGRSEWFTHLSNRLLDRIGVEAVERSVATRTDDSIVIATRTDPAFGLEGPRTNQWFTIARSAATETRGPAQPYVGGISYVKITRLASHPGSLLVEAHFAFVEPLGWFQGNPILRSKIGLVAQEQIRRLRREIEKAGETNPTR